MKLFTTEEANELLPMVKPILVAIKRQYLQLQKMQGAAQLAAEAGAQAGGGGMSNGNGARYAQALLSLSERTAALSALGVQIKDYERGLIDFPSLREGRVILLCWLLGEGERIEWWHEVDAGFAGRQAL